MSRNRKIIRFINLKILLIRISSYFNLLILTKLIVVTTIKKSCSNYFVVKKRIASSYVRKCVQFAKNLIQFKLAQLNVKKFIKSKECVYVIKRNKKNSLKYNIVFYEKLLKRLEQLLRERNQLILKF